MKNLIIILSIIGLLLTIIPSFLVFSKYIEPATSKILMFIGTLIWFLTAPFWLNKSTEKSEI